VVWLSPCICLSSKWAKWFKQHVNQKQILP
jgi:hypothetical protein